MTYVEKGVINDVVTVPELFLRIYDNNNNNNNTNNNINITNNVHNNNNEGYIHLSQCDDHDDDHDELTVENECLIEESRARVRWCFIWKWIKLFVLFVILAGLALVFFKWVGPFLMDKGIIPIINWERTSFSTPHLVLIVFVTVSLFPTICLPSTPSMWVAGMTFGYGFGFLLIMPAVITGISLPYLIGHLFHHKIQGWMERYPKKASLIRLAGEGGWLDQFQAVALIRISPFPYIIYNYCAVATNVKYGPYILGSIIGMVPDVLVAIYTGILIKTLADATYDNHSLSAQEIILNVVGFAATVATTIICTILAKKRLKTMPIEDESLLQ